MIAPTIDIPMKPAEDILRFQRETWDAVEVDISRYADIRSAYKSYLKVLRRLRDQGSAGNIDIRARDGHLYLVKPAEIGWDGETEEGAALPPSPDDNRKAAELRTSLREIRRLRMDVAERLPDVGAVTKGKLHALDAALERDEKRLVNELRDLGEDVG